jgi:alpha-D-xyloside xylohydrolase
MFMQRFLSVFALVAGITLIAVCSQAQNPSQRLELDRKGETIVLEPYAPNILRVTLSLQPESALASPGYGVLAAPDHAG